MNRRASRAAAILLVMTLGVATLGSRAPTSWNPTTWTPWASPALAQDTEEAQIVGASGRPLPRFVSLKSNQVNLRTGPGTRYPVSWVYQRRYLPMEVTQETEDWRRVRDPDGTEGWVHRAMLSGQRMAVVIGQTRQILLRGPEPDAEGIAEVEPRVIVKLLQCPVEGLHCRVEAGRFQGWLPRIALWGIYPGEYVDR